MASVVPLAVLLALFVPAQMYPDCKHCESQSMSKGERAMFLAYSDACRAESGASPDEAAALLAGRVEDTPAARRHVYCVLRRGKLVGKDGKPRKPAVLDKLLARAQEKNAAKVLAECFEQGGDAPEDFTWSLYRCGYDEKKRLFEQLRAAVGSPDKASD